MPDSNEKELVPNVHAELDGNGNVNLFTIIKSLTEIDYKVQNTMVSYFSSKDDMWVLNR